MDASVDTRRSASTTPRRQRNVLRYLVRQVHLWLGATVGLLLAAIGLSGALLVFAEPLVKWQAPQLYHDGGPGEWRPVSEWQASAEAKYPELKPLTFMYGPGTIPMPTGVPIFFTLTKKDGHERHTLIPIDPVAGKVLDRVDAEDTLAGLLVIFHKELLAHDTGILLVAIAGVIGLVSVVSGLYLWWPRRGNWSAALKFRRGARGSALLYDLHSVPGFWVLIPLGIALFSGVYLQKHDWVDPIVGVFSDVREPDFTKTVSSPAGTCPTPTTIDDAVRLAKESREDQVVRLLWGPRTPTGVYKVELRKPSANTRAEGTTVYVDRHCPRVIEIAAVEHMTAGERLKGSMWPLHTNLMLGLVGQALVFLAGLALPLLFVTGVWFWLKTLRR
jgi:uncharacterized iron-regulated membrane protein